MFCCCVLFLLRISSCSILVFRCWGNLTLLRPAPEKAFSRICAFPAFLILSVKDTICVAAELTCKAEKMLKTGTLRKNTLTKNTLTKNTFTKIQTKKQNTNKCSLFYCDNPPIGHLHQARSTLMSMSSFGREQFLDWKQFHIQSKSKLASSSLFCFAVCCITGCAFRNWDSKSQRAKVYNPPKYKTHQILNKKSITWPRRGEIHLWDSRTPWPPK